MSQAASAPSDGPGPSVERSQHIGQRLLERLREKRGVCPSCYRRTHHYHDEATEAQEEKAKGTLLRPTAVRDRDPATYSEVVPPTSLPVDPDEAPLGRETEWRPARGRTVCECGVIDHDDDPGPQTARERREAVRNVAARCREEDRPFDWVAALEVLAAAAGRDSVQGRPTDLLRMAVGFGLAKG